MESSVDETEEGEGCDLEYDVTTRNTELGQYLASLQLESLGQIGIFDFDDENERLQGSRSEDGTGRSLLEKLKTNPISSGLIKYLSLPALVLQTLVQKIGEMTVVTLHDFTQTFSVHTLAAFQRRREIRRKYLDICRQSRLFDIPVQARFTREYRLFHNTRILKFEAERLMSLLAIIEDAALRVLRMKYECTSLPEESLHRVFNELQESSNRLSEQKLVLNNLINLELQLLHVVPNFVPQKLEFASPVQINPIFNKESVISLTSEDPSLSNPEQNIQGTFETNVSESMSEDDKSNYLASYDEVFEMIIDNKSKKTIIAVKNDEEDRKDLILIERALMSQLRSKLRDVRNVMQEREELALKRVKKVLK